MLRKGGKGLRVQAGKGSGLGCSVDRVEGLGQVHRQLGNRDVSIPVAVTRKQNCCAVDKAHSIP